MPEKQHPPEPEFTIEWLRVKIGGRYMYHGLSPQGIKLRIASSYPGDKELEALYLEENAIVGDYLNRVPMVHRLPVWCSLLSMTVNAMPVKHDETVLALKEYAEMLYGANPVLPGYKKS